jgi:hypothetical protein
MADQTQNAGSRMNQKDAAVRFQERPDYLEIARQHNKAIQKVFTDSVYIVEVYETAGAGPFDCHLAVKRVDCSPIRTWRALQDIKNEIVGADAIAIEIYPRESEVTDTANLYHLWVLRRGFEVPAVLIPPKRDEWGE